MSDESADRLAFLDSLTRFFRRDAKATQAPPAEPASTAANRLEGLQSELQAALEGLDAKVRQRLETSASASPAASRAVTAEEREAERQRRMAECHRAIREDVEKMHARLKTGLRGEALDDVAKFLVDLEEFTRAGKDSRALLPRARHAIARRFEEESGTLAADRLVALLGREGIAWPDPIQRGPSMTPEEVERSRRRRLAETREAFLASGLRRTANRMLGIVSAWGSDYPDRSSPLWEECVLEAVAAGIRGDLLREFVEVLRADAEAINAKAESFIGKEVAALQDVLRGGVTSIEQANQATASALRVLDEVVPEIAWEDVREKVPRARGEWAS